MIIWSYGNQHIKAGGYFDTSKKRWAKGLLDYISDYEPLDIRSEPISQVLRDAMRRIFTGRPRVQQVDLGRFGFTEE